MLNRYEMEVRAQCPVNPQDTDLYQFTIESKSMIKVEDIIGFFDVNAGQKHVFQEALTLRAATTLGARVISIGYHSGVKVTCCAP